MQQPLLQGINHDAQHNATLINVIAETGQRGVLWFGAPWGETRLYIAHQRVIHAENPFTEGEEAVFFLLDHKGSLNYAFYAGRPAPRETITQPLTTLFLQAFSDEPIPELWDDLYLVIHDLIGPKTLPLMLTVKRNLHIGGVLHRRHAVRFLHQCLDHLPPLDHAQQDRLNIAVSHLYQTYLPEANTPASIQW